MNWNTVMFHADTPITNIKTRHPPKNKQLPGWFGASTNLKMRRRNFMFLFWEELRLQDGAGKKKDVIRFVRGKLHYQKQPHSWGEERKVDRLMWGFPLACFLVFCSQTLMFVQKLHLLSYRNAFSGAASGRGSKFAGWFKRHGPWAEWVIQTVYTHHEIRLDWRITSYVMRAYTHGLMKLLWGPKWKEKKN